MTNQGADSEPTGKQKYRREFLKRASAVSGVAGMGAIAGCAGDGATSNDTTTAGDGSSLSDEEKRGGSFVFGLGGTISNLAWYKTYDFVTNNPVMHIYDPLLAFDDDEEMEPQPALASDFSIDGSEYVLTLRDDVVFHNGDEMTADDVVASIEFLQSDQAASPVAWMYDNLESLEKTGDYEVTFTLSEPDAVFQFVLCQSAAAVTSKSALENSDADTPQAQEPIGAGPYKLEEWESGSYVRTTRFEDYYDDPYPYFDEIEWRVIESGTTRVTGLKNGEVHMTNRIPLRQQDTVESFDNIEYPTVTGYLNKGFAFHTQKEPFNDVHVRRAVNYLLDKQAIVDDLLAGHATPAKTPIPPTNWAYTDDVPSYEYSVEDAQAEMEQSNHPDGFDTTIIIQKSQIQSDMAQKLQQELKQINVNAEIVKRPYAEWYQAFRSGKFELMATVYGSDFPDPSGLMYPWYTSFNLPPDGVNFFYYENEEYDDLVTRAKQSYDQEQRKELYAQAQRKLQEDVPHALTHHTEQIMPHQQNVEGFTLNPMYYWRHYLKKAYFTDN